MSTLYGTLIGHLTREHEVHTSALNANVELVNRFGDEMRLLELVPHVRAQDRNSIVCVAHCLRGRDHVPVLQALTGRGYKVGTAEKLPHQFNDGYVIWRARVTSRTMSFDLVFYTMVDAA
jgi:hypothetical protein